MHTVNNLLGDHNILTSTFAWKETTLKRANKGIQV